MLANLKNYKQAVLLNLDEDNQVHILGAIPLDQESNSIESLSNDSDKKMFKVRKNRSNSSKKLRSLVNLKSVRSLSPSSKDSKSNSNKLSLFSGSDDESDRFQNLVIDLSDNSSHKQQIAQINQSEDTVSRDDSLMNLSDDGFMGAYCKSLGYGTDNCRKWAGHSVKSKSTNINSAKSDSDNDNKSTSSFTDSDDDSRSVSNSSNSALSEYLMQLNMFTKMGKGLKKMENGAKKAVKVGKKYAPMADKAFAIAAPQNHAKYAPVLANEYKAFNTQANAMGGWNSVDKAANTLQGMGLIQLKSKKTTMMKVCDKLEREAHENPLFISNTKKGIAYRTNLQSQIENLGCY